MKKIKNNIAGFIASIVTVLIPMIAGMILWGKLPDRIALHFDFQGNPDDYYSKGFAVFGIYLIILAIHLLVSVATALENEKGEGIPDKLYGILIWICPAVSLLAAVLSYSNALGYKMNVAFWCMLFIGFLYLVLGNYTPKVRPNKFAGVRVKWTFESKKNWEHTNRFSGWVMCIVGIVFIMMALTGFYNITAAYWMPVVLVLLVIASVGIVTVYSFLYYKKHREEDDYYNE